MILAADIGNTQSVFAALDAGEIKGQWRIATDHKKSEDEYFVALKSMFEASVLDIKNVNDMIFSSVVPACEMPLQRLAEKYFKAQALEVNFKTLEKIIKIDVDEPEEVGADRLVNAVSAFEKYNEPLIILDFGTATTFDLVDEGGYHGGVIAPGVNLSLGALENAAARLPKIEIKDPGKVIGKSTTCAMQSGIYYGYLSMIEGIITRLKSEFNADAKIIATGGLAKIFAANSNLISHISENLTIEGLSLIYDRLKKI